MDDEEKKNEETEEIIEESVETEIDAFDQSEEKEEIQTVTLFETPKGPISVVHDITLGDLIVSTVLMALLIHQVISQTIRSMRDV